MQALRDHLQRMHNANYIVSRWEFEVGDILNIEFEPHPAILIFPWSALERNLATQINKLEAAHYGSGARCYVEYGISTIVNFIKDYKIESNCHECKGTGYYYPLIGEREPCQTCQK